MLYGTFAALRCLQRIDNRHGPSPWRAVGGKNDVLGLQTDRIFMWSTAVCVDVSAHIHQATRPRSKLFSLSRNEGITLGRLDALLQTLSKDEMESEEGDVHKSA